MASALKKFLELEKTLDLEEEKKEPETKAPKRKKLHLYEHIANRFEGKDAKEERRRRTIERQQIREKEKKDLEEKERIKREEEQELLRIKKEEEERIIRQQIEEQKRLEEQQILLAKEEEKLKQDQAKRKNLKENKYEGMKPAVAMFERALDAKRSVQNSVSGTRVTSMKKGTISEIRSKIFDNKKHQEQQIIEKNRNLLKQAPKKHIISSKEEPQKESKVPEEVNEISEANLSEGTMVERSDDSVKINMKTPEIELDKIKEISTKEHSSELPSEKETNKRQSFISDFAALEKTYKILGLSRDTEKIEESKEPIKKRHNSEGKVKNKDKAKAKRKTSVMSDFESSEKSDPKPLEKERKIDAMEKRQNNMKKSFFQDMINEKKGVVKKEPELMGPQIRKKSSIASSFEQNMVDNNRNKRHSVTLDNVRVDSQKFNTSINRFESKDQRAEAKLQMMKITNEQKKFEKQKQEREDQRRLEIEADEKRKREEDEALLQAEYEEQIIMEKIKEIEAETERIKLLENENLKMEEEATVPKKKSIKKKKKKSTQEAPPSKVDEAPKLSLSVVDYNNVKSRFEGKKKLDQENEVKEPTKPLRINKLTVNPFEQKDNIEDNSSSKEIKVNKLQKNAFIQQLEKRGSLAMEEKQIKKTLPPKAERTKKFSDQTCIKFESKKERKTSEDVKKQDTGERKSEVRVSKSIEAPQAKKKSLNEKKTSSSLSLHKIFIDGPKEFFKSSKEKLYKLSKETLCEGNEPVEEAKVEEKEEKPSRSEMQNYLLSHVLFDGKDVVKKEKVVETVDDDIEKYLDEDYKAKIKQYCSLLEDEKPQKKKKKKKKTTKKVEDNLPTLKTVEIKNLQEQIQQKLERPLPKKDIKEDCEVFPINTRKVSKFKEIFDNENKNKTIDVDTEKKQPNRRSKSVKSDIFSKIQALENSEKDRLEREKINEERMRLLLEKEIERQTQNENDIIDNEEIFADEALKNNILQCLEDEVLNLEQEMVALDNQELLIIEEEEEDFLNNNEIINIINEDDIETHQQQIYELHEEIVERKKEATKKKKVLERFQHVFEKDEVDKVSGLKVGSIQDRLSIFLEHTDTKNKKYFEDNALIGVSDVMSKVKEKFETQDDEKLTLFTKEEVKRKVNQNALKFEMLTAPDDSSEMLTPKSPVNNDWTWKKKTLEELQVVNQIENEQPITNEVEKPHFQDTKFSEILADINAVKQRLLEREADRSERENEEKLKEMEDVINEVQESLKIHEEALFSDDNDNIQRIKKEKKKSIDERVKRIEKIPPREHNIDNLKNMLTNQANDEHNYRDSKKDEVEKFVSVSQIRKQIINKQSEEETNAKDSIDDEKERKVSSNLIFKIAEKLVQDDQEDSFELQKAPKLLLRSNSDDVEEGPTKTLEELKEAQESQTWRWKERSLADLQNYIHANDNIAPSDILSKQQNLEDLDEELHVVQKCLDDKDTDIIMQIREEKEKEFNQFMKDVKSYLSKDTDTKEEKEFKEGMQGYLDLVDDNDSISKQMLDKKRTPAISLNTVSRIKSDLLDNTPTPNVRRSSIKVNKLETDKIESNLRPVETPKPKTKDYVKSDNTLKVKQLFEDKTIREPSPIKSPVSSRKTSGKLSMMERFNQKNKEAISTKLQHQLKFKQKTIGDLHDYIANNEKLANESLLAHQRSFKVCKESEKLEFHELFISSVNKLLLEQPTSDEQNIFMGNIKAYLSVLDNVDSTYNATPKLRKHKGSTNQSNMRKAIIEKSCERNNNIAKDTPIKDQQKSIIKKPEEEEVKSPEEKRKEILAKYGFKDRMKPIEIQPISDDDTDDDDLDEVDMKTLSDRELCDKYGLPYFETHEDKSNTKSEPSSDYVGILSKIRTAGSEKSKSILNSKSIFENDPSSIPRRNSSCFEDVPKSPSMTKIRHRFEPDSQQNLENNKTSTPRFQPGSIVTEKLRKSYEDEIKSKRGSFVEDESNSRCTSPFSPEVVRSGSTSKMKMMFEAGSNNSSRSASPLLRSEPGSLITTKLKKRYEEQALSSNRNSYIDDDSRSNSPFTVMNEVERSRSNTKMRKTFEYDSPTSERSCSPLLRTDPGTVIASKLKHRFESMASEETASPILRNRGLQKSSTVSNIGNAFEKSSNKSSKDEMQKMHNATAFLSQDRQIKSPSLTRVSGLEKSKSMSKIKHAFESGKGLNDDEDEEPSKTDQRKTVHAELELLKSQSGSNNNVTSGGKSSSDLDITKQNIALSFFNSKDTTPKEANRNDSMRKAFQYNDSSRSSGNTPNLSKTFVTHTKREIQKSSTMSDIGSFLKAAGKDSPGIARKELVKPITNQEKKIDENKSQSPLLRKYLNLESPRVARKELITPTFNETQKVDEPKSHSPVLRKNHNLQRNESFSKFKNAFEEGKGLNNENDDTQINCNQRNIQNELTELQSSSKLQKMFRINRSKSNVNESPKSEHVDLDEDTIKEVSRSRSAITNMFESQGPKMTFGGVQKPDKVEQKKPKPPQKKEEDINERKWVFDTIQKYFDVIVEDENEDLEEENVDYDDNNNDGDSESDYTDADDKIPNIELPSININIANNIKSKSPIKQNIEPVEKNKFSTLAHTNPTSLQSKKSTSLQRTSSLRSTSTTMISPVLQSTLAQKKVVERKVSTISIDDYVDDAARKFDELTDGGTDWSENEDDKEPRKTILSRQQSASSQTINKLTRSSSSSRMRSMFTSVVHGSGSNLNVSKFKSNLSAHLKSREELGSRNLDPGVGEQQDSSSEYSEYD